MRYKLNMNFSKCNSFLITVSNIITAVSNDFLELVGYTEMEIINKNIKEVFSKQLRLPDNILEQINLWGSKEDFLFTKSFEAREVTISVSQGLSMYEKIYAIKEKPHSRLENKFSFLEMIFLKNISGIAIYSSDLILLKANQNYINHLDGTLNLKENYIGLSIFEILKGLKGSESEKRWKRIVKTGESLNVFELAYKNLNKSTSYWDASCVPIFENDQIKYLIHSANDVTERVINRNRVYEQNRIIQRQNEQMETIMNDISEMLQKTTEAKEEFISLISHEFKTPLTVINSAIQAMELICKNELSDKAKGFLNKIKQNSNRQLKLVNNLLDITRMNTGHFKVVLKDMDIVLLSKSITESIIMYAEQKGIRLSFSSTLKSKVIGIDEEKYGRILLNLLSNAVKYTPEGKSISVRVSQKVILGKCKVCIQVRDNGIGIPDNKKNLIFDKFSQVDSSLTRQAEGTGIGLHLVKMLVEMLKGEISLESKEGEGSTFSVILPIDKVKDTPIEQMIKEIYEQRLIHATAIEFSDIYL